VGVRLRGALSLEDVASSAEAANIKHDIECEACKYGDLVSVTLPEPSAGASEREGGTAGDSWTGDVLLKYANKLSAERAAEALQGRLFGDQPLVAMVLEVR
jgi:hypothetical protein